MLLRAVACLRFGGIATTVARGVVAMTLAVVGGDGGVDLGGPGCTSRRQHRTQTPVSSRCSRVLRTCACARVKGESDEKRMQLYC